MRLGFHHFHVRKRVHKNLEPYPHPDTSKRVMDSLVYVIALFGPLFVLPQTLKIWLYANAEGVSGITFGALSLFALIWLGYGIMHKEKPIIIANALYCTFNLITFIGAVVYGTQPFTIF